jgi:hypothetical protein
MTRISNTTSANTNGQSSERGLKQARHARYLTND